MTRAATGGTDDASRSGCRAAARSSSASHARANRAVAPAVRRCDLHARISIGRDACDLQPLMQRTYLLRDAARRPGNSPSSSATRAQSARRARADAGRLRQCGVPAQVASAGLNRLNVIVPPALLPLAEFHWPPDLLRHALVSGDLEVAAHATTRGTELRVVGTTPGWRLSPASANRWTETHVSTQPVRPRRSVSAGGARVGAGARRSPLLRSGALR